MHTSGFRVTVEISERAATQNFGDTEAEIKSYAERFAEIQRLVKLGQTDFPSHLEASHLLYEFLMELVKGDIVGRDNRIQDIPGLKLNPAHQKLLESLYVDLGMAPMTPEERRTLADRVASGRVMLADDMKAVRLIRAGQAKLGRREGIDDDYIIILAKRYRAEMDLKGKGDTE